MRDIHNYNIKIIDLLNRRETRTKFCTCELMNDRITKSKLLRKEDFINLFFITWIDQVVYWLLVDSENEFCLKNFELYEIFLTNFVFPKFTEHGCGHYARPVIFLIEFYRKNLLSENELLFLSKLKYWDLGVKKFFQRIGRRDIVEFAEQEFIRDLSLRHRFSEDQESKLRYLWETKLIN